MLVPEIYIYSYFVLHLHILDNTRTQNFDVAHIPGSQMAKIRNVYE